MSEDVMAGRHHQCNGYELWQTSGVGEAQTRLACCSPRDCRVGHDWATEQQQQTNDDPSAHFLVVSFYVLL